MVWGSLAVCSRQCISAYFVKGKVGVTLLPVYDILVTQLEVFGYIGSAEGPEIGTIQRKGV